MASIYWIVFFITQIAVGVITAIAAKKKNRDEFGWFIIGLLFGFLGLIAALVIDEIEPTQGGSAEGFDPYRYAKTCPECAEKIKLEARVCRFCGNRFPDDDVEDAVNEMQWQFLVERRPELRNNKGKYCNFCGSVTEENYGEPPYRACEECAGIGLTV